MPSKKEVEQPTAPADDDASMTEAPAAEEVQEEEANPVLLAFEEQRIRIVTALACTLHML
jgi:hypothetical protein